MKQGEARLGNLSPDIYTIIKVVAEKIGQEDFIRKFTSPELIIDSIVNKKGEVELEGTITVPPLTDLASVTKYLTDLHELDITNQQEGYATSHPDWLLECLN